MKTILGINSVYHESSASLIKNGKVLVAAEEERFSRTKHAKEAMVDNPHHLPFQAIEFCLKNAGMRANEIDAFCYSFDPDLRTHQFQIDTDAQANSWGSTKGEEIFRTCLAKVPVALSKFLNVDIQNRFHWVKHHVAHAASAFFMSEFRESAIVVADGIAENASTMIAKANDTKIIELNEIHYPHSLGFLWEKLSEFMGFTSFDAAKVMGLAAYGDENLFSRAFNSLAWINKQGFQVDRLLAQFRQLEFYNMAKLFGPERRQSEEISKRHCDLAASLQKFTNEAILTLSKKAFDMFPQKNLCLTGGLALNCTSNQFIKEHGPFENLYIPSAPHDSGTAAGAALAIYYNSNGRCKTSDNNLIDPYFGPDFGDEEIKYECAQHDLDAKYAEKPWEEAAILISQGKIIGWFQDRMEFGPRALGNRSILADPRSIHTRERLNKDIKHRENFRPFAPSVLAEAANEWFLLGRPSKSFRYMIFACPVRQDKAKLIPAVVHVDSSSRVQLVTHEDNPKFYNLIKFFYEKTGIPLVLNTSFNVSEPIVCTPKDALRTFVNSELDALVIGNYILIRD